MNINPLILTNVQGSPYFKVELFTIKTFHEVVDQIYYKVDHLEPWATGSRKTAGRSQTGMCGGVRGVSAGGIVSSCFCLLYKLYTLKVTKKQVYALIEHVDSPYIRGIGFMFLRYTLPPQLMWDWFEPYLDDEEEIDIKAGGGKPMTIGEMCRLMLTRLEWFDTRFPRIAVNFEKQIRENLEARQREQQEWDNQQGFAEKPDHGSPGGRSAGRASRDRDSRTKEREQRDPKSKDRESKPRDKRSRSRDRRSRSKHRKSRSRERRSRSRDRRSRSREKKKEKKRDRSRSRERHHKKHKKERSRERRRSISRSRSRESKHKSKDDDYSQELKKFKDDASKMKKKSKRSRSRS